MDKIHIAEFTELIFYKKENRIDFFNKNIKSLNNKKQTSLLHSCGYFGDLEMVKWFFNREEKEFIFDEKLYGCSKEEYVFMAACHPEGKEVRHYLFKEKNLQLSEDVLHWISANKLTKLIPKSQKVKI